MSLTEAAIRAAKPREKEYKLRDGRGLYLLVTPSGGRLWRFRYRYAGKEKMISLGPYPEIGLKEARERREAARVQVEHGVNPSAERRASGQTFAQVAAEWMDTRGYAASSRERMDVIAGRVAEQLGGVPLARVSIDQVRDALLHIARAHGRGLQGGSRTTAERARWMVVCVIRFSRARGYGGPELTDDAREGLKEALGKAPKGHHAALIIPPKVGELLRKIDAYPGTMSVKWGLKLLPHLFCRPAELWGMEWTELDGAMWRIPDARTKLRRQHLVPLSRQVLALLDELREWHGACRYVLPSRDDPGRPLSLGAAPKALRWMGYPHEVHTAHGFRKTASTLLHELAPSLHAAIEMQLAHVRGGAHGIYNAAEHLPIRVGLMQVWSDYLDALKAGDPGADLSGRLAIQAMMADSRHPTVR